MVQNFLHAHVAIYSLAGSRFLTAVQLLTSACFPIKRLFDVQVTGDITYNGYRLDEFVVRRTCSYVDQYDNHTPELTVRETLDFAARCQTAGLGASRCYGSLQLT